MDSWHGRNDIDMKIILPVKFSGVSSNLNSKSLTSWLSCNVLNPWEIFHSNSIGSPSILSKFLYSWDVLNHPNLCSHAAFNWCSRLSYQSITQNLKIRKPSRARDWWLLHHQTKINASMKNLPSEFYSLHKSHLIVQLSTFQICQISVSLWDPFLYFWWNVNFLSNSFPWIQKLVMSKTNILHIKECLLLSCVASSEERSNIFRNRSFTLLKNDRDLREWFDSVGVLESVSTKMTDSLDTGPTIHVFDISPDSHSWEDHLSVQVLSPIGIVPVDGPASSRLRGFALAFDRLAKALAFNFNAYSSNCFSEVSCSLLFKFVTNLFKPW